MAPVSHPPTPHPCQPPARRLRLLCACRPWRAAWRHLLGLASLLAVVSARADTHALILTIGNYAEPSAKLVGIDHDARMALDIVKRLGATQWVALADRELDFRGMARALDALEQRIRPGDTVIVYYSGHGRRQYSTAWADCQESLVTVDNLNYFETALQADLLALAAKAGRVIMLNDSCHAGGAVTKGFGIESGTAGAQPKVYPGHLPEPAEAKQAAALQQASPAAQAACYRISNAVTKSFNALPGPEGKLVYLAAAGLDEVAWATPEGSLGTRAWHRCVLAADSRDDANRDGRLSARELAQCAQRWLNTAHARLPQRITPQFNADLPLLPVASRTPR